MMRGWVDGLFVAESMMVCVCLPHDWEHNASDCEVTSAQNDGELCFAVQKKIRVSAKRARVDRKSDGQHPRAEVNSKESCQTLWEKQ